MDAQQAQAGRRTKHSHQENCIEPANVQSRTALAKRQSLASNCPHVDLSANVREELVHPVHSITPGCPEDSVALSLSGHYRADQSSTGRDLPLPASSGRGTRWKWQGCVRQAKATPGGRDQSFPDRCQEEGKG